MLTVVYTRERQSVLCACARERLSLILLVCVLVGYVHYLAYTPVRASSTFFGTVIAGFDRGVLRVRADAAVLALRAPNLVACLLFSASISKLTLVAPASAVDANPSRLFKLFSR